MTRVPVEVVASSSTVTADYGSGYHEHLQLTTSVVPQQDVALYILYHPVTIGELHYYRKII